MMKIDESDEKTILVLHHIKDLPVHPQLLIFKTSSGADLISVGNIIGRSVLISSSFSHERNIDKITLLSNAFNEKNMSNCPRSTIFRKYLFP